MRKLSKMLLGFVLCLTSAITVHADTDVNVIEFQEESYLTAGNDMDYNTVINDFYQQYNIYPDYLDYTEVNLELCDTGDTRYVRPAQGNQGVSLQAIGGTSYSPYGNLKLYTAASFNGNNIYASSVAIYTSLSAGVYDAPETGCYDYISLTSPQHIQFSRDTMSAQAITEHIMQMRIIMELL